MTSIFNKEKRMRHLQHLKAGYIFVFLPLLAMVILRLTRGEYSDIYMSADWSLASAIIFGQLAARTSVAVADVKVKSSGSAMEYYMAKRIALVIASILIYVSLMITPSLWLAIFQVAWFFLASYFYFKDGMAAFLLSQKI